MRRPQPPAKLLEPGLAPDLFVPAPKLAEWLRVTFIEESGKAWNEDHAHLLMARIGALWTNAEYTKQQRPIAGQAEVAKPPQMVNAWAKARWKQQVREWFGFIPDFIITISAPTWAGYDNASAMALSEHELYHCYLIRVTNQGIPIWGILGHDVEEHIGVVERYGPGACGSNVQRLVELARQKPLISRATISAACGACLKLAA